VADLRKAGLGRFHDATTTGDAELISKTIDELVGKVADELAIVGIHGFVAHNTMTYSRPWQAQIEQAPTPIYTNPMLSCVDVVRVC
jgi:hypothetical protein